MGDVITGKDLATLIADGKGSRSYESVARACGGAPTAARLHQLATTPLKNFPDPPTIQGLARGLGTTVTEVVLASARSLGLSVQAGDAGAMVLETAGLTPRQVEAVQSVIRAMQDPGQEAGEHRGDTAPMNEPIDLARRRVKHPQPPDKRQPIPDQVAALDRGEASMGERVRSEHDKVSEAPDEPGPEHGA